MNIAASLAGALMMLVAADARSATSQPIHPVGSAQAADAPVAPAKRDATTLAKPQPTRAALLNGKEIVGTIERWDEQGVSGTFGGSVITVRWEELAPNDVYRVRKRLIDAIDDRDARRAHFLECASFLWSVEGGDRLALRAIDEAKRLGADNAAIEAARQGAVALRGARQQRDAAAESQALRTGLPDAEAALGAAGPTAWTSPSAHTLAQVITELRSIATAKLAASGGELLATESAHAIVYSDLGAADGANRGTEIDGFIVNTLPHVGLTRATQPWWGKLIVFAIKDPDRFALLEASGFGQRARPEDVAFTHYDGPRVFVVVKIQPDALATRIETARAVTRAILYRHQTALRLPLWLQEGLVDWLVSVDRPTKSLDARLRGPGLRFVRSGGSLTGLFDAKYAPGSPPFTNDEARGAAFLVASYLGEKESERFIGFIMAAKRTPDWKSAFEQSFGASVERVTDVMRGYYRMND